MEFASRNKHTDIHTKVRCAWLFHSDSVATNREEPSEALEELFRGME